MTTDPFDEFDTPTQLDPSDAIIRGGRYRLPRRDGTHKPYGWQRVSNLVSAYSDQYALRNWEMGEVLAGVAADPDVLAELIRCAPQDMSKDERWAWTEAFIEKAKDASGGNRAAKHGTQRHEAVHEHHQGLPPIHQDAGTRRALALYASALERHNFMALPGMQERRVLIESLEACGTLDNIVAEICQPCQGSGERDEDTVCPNCAGAGQVGTLRIADLKTQRRFWTWLEIGAQLACYAHGDAMWDVATGTWVGMPPVDQNVAHVLWMPRTELGEEPHVEVWDVDIVAGWKTAQRAYEVVKDRAAAKSVKGRRAWLRPAPPASETERWAARFAAADTHAEGAQLVREAKIAGVWDGTLAMSARAAYDRLSALEAAS